MQLKSFVKDLAFVQVVNFIVKPLWIVAVDRTVQNLLGQEIYGEYFLAFNLAAVFFIITDLGLNNYLTKNAVDQEKGARGIIFNSIKLKIILSLIYFVLVLLLGWQRQIPMYLLIWVAINHVLIGISQWLRVWFNASRQFRKESIIAIIDRLVAILLWVGIIALLSLNDSETLKVFLGVQTAGLLAAICGALLLIHLGEKGSKEYIIHNIGQVIWECLPFTLLAFFMAAFTRADVILMDFLQSPTSADYHIGVYAQGAVLLNAGNMMAALFGTMLLPIFSRQIKIGEDVRPIMRTSVVIILASVFILVAVLFLWGKDFYLLYYKGTVSDSFQLDYQYQTFVTVLLVYAPMALTYIFGTFITALGHLRFLVLLSFLALVLNLSANFILQPELKALGAAWAANITQWFFCLACLGYTLMNLRKKN